MAILTCECGKWMHTEGIEEQIDATGVERWLVRSVCCSCGLRVAADAPPVEAIALVDRLLWSDHARHVLDRMPPYLAPMVQREVEDYARSGGRRVITFNLLMEARQGGAVVWTVEAERRLENVPAPVRAMARIELERTALEKGQREVTIALMEEVKARYFGLSSKAVTGGTRRIPGATGPSVG